MRSISALFIALTATPALAAEPRVDSLGDPLPPGAVARFGTLRLWCPASVNHLEFSGDGKFVLGMEVRQGGSVVWVWETRSGTLVASSEQIAAHAVFTPDNKIVLVGVSAHCRLLDPVTGKCRTLWRETDREATMAAFSPDGRTLAVSLAGGHVALVDPATGKERERIALLGNWGTLLTFSPDSRVLAIGMHQGHVWLWDCVGHKQLRSYKIGGTSQDMVMAVAFSPDSRTVAVAARTGEKFPVKLFKVAGEGEVEGFKRSDSELIMALRFSADGKSLLGASYRGQLFTWDAKNGKEIRVVGKPEEDREAVVIDPAGNGLAAARYGRLMLLDGRDGKPRVDAKHYLPLKELAVADKRDTLVLADVSGTVHYWEIGAARPSRSKEFFSPDLSFLSPDGSRSLNWVFSTFTVHDTATGKEIWAHTTAVESGGRAAFSPDHKQIVVLTMSKAGIQLWDAKGKKHHRLALENPLSNPAAIAWSPDCRNVAVVETEKGTGYVWEVATGMVRQKIQPREAADACFLVDGRHLAVACRGGGIQVFRLGSDAHPREIGIHGELASLTASADGRWLAAGAQDGRIVLLDPATGTIRHELRGHHAVVSAVRFSRDSSRLFSCSADGTALVWEVKSLPKPGDNKPTASMSVEQCWTALAGSDASAALRAKVSLEAQPKEAVALIKERLLKTPPRDRKQFVRWVEELNSPNYTARQKAAKALEEAAEQAEGALRAALETAGTLEQRRRIEELLDKLDGPIARPELLRAVRAVEALETIATPEAKSVLETLAKGDAGARLTREAKAALERMGR